MPAQSPTLSPTLSAITAGLRGSSSGIPASTLPTRSAPTSAPLVKMPPPRRAKIEISDAPKLRATSASMIGRTEPSAALPVQQHIIVAADAEQAEADDQQAGDGARPESDAERLLHAFPGGSRRAHIGAHRNIHADITGEARQHRADDKADRDMQPRKRPSATQMTTPTSAIVIYWRLR